MQRFRRATVYKLSVLRSYHTHVAVVSLISANRFRAKARQGFIPFAVHLFHSAFHNMVVLSHGTFILSIKYRELRTLGTELLLLNASSPVFFQICRLPRSSGSPAIFTMADVMRLSSSGEMQYGGMV